MKPQLITHFKAFLWMIFGVLFIFVTVIMMNNETDKPAPKKKRVSKQIEVQKMTKPKPKAKPKPKPKKKAKTKKAASHAPKVGSSLGGVDLGLAEFAAGDMGELGESLLGDVNKNVVMSEDSVDVAPRPSERGAIEYPKRARKLGITGYVMMNILINKNGNVEEVKVLESEPVGVFNDVAVMAIKEWHFHPAQYQGQAVKVWAKQKIRFDLN